MPWEDVKAVFRPETVHMGVMQVDAELCTSCGLCLENCLLRAWVLDDKGIPQLKDKYACFSCHNCMVCCPTDAISVVEGYHVHEGPHATAPYPLPQRMPLEPRDAAGNLTDFNTVERTVYERRSVRNYRDRPVPESLIRRVLEAGRHSPSGGNSQPWKFVVVTNKALIDEMNKVILAGMARGLEAYQDDEKVKQVAAAWETNPARNSGSFDPRIIQGGQKSIVDNQIPPLQGAPVVILLCADDRAIGGPQMQLGIAGTNMTLVANSLGLGAYWVGFAAFVAASPAIMEKLDIKPPFRVNTSIVLGYPRFKQAGTVPREYRPVSWYREGSDKLEIEE